MKNRINLQPENSGGLQGKFLVASAALEGTPFARTVVLILQHNEHGIFGVILNRPANAELKQSWQAVVGGNENIEAKRSLDHLQEGGPKGGPVIVLHPIESLAEVEIDPGVFMSANSDLISQIVRSGDQRYRIFCGVAAWTNKQIITEMDAGLWFATEGDTNMVFAEQEIIWGNALLRYGRSVLCEILQVKHLPHDPSLN